MIVAFAGNPNSGKTTLFNVLTGGNERVGNWAGVTIEKKIGKIKKKFNQGKEITAVDLPGAYSIAPFTNEEGVTSNFIKEEHVDVIINIVDATNISRSLFFTTQLMEYGVPVVVALNKADLIAKKGTTIDADKLSALLGCPVIETVSLMGKGKGVADLIPTAISLVGKEQTVPFATELADEEADRARFAFVDTLVEQVEVKTVKTNVVSKQDKADKVLAHRIWGLPIFALVMLVIFTVSQTWVGTWIADILVGWIESFQTWVGELLADANPFLSSLLVDGIIGGVGAVVGFLPLIMVLMFLIALLEDCGYMARIAVIMDKLLKKVGLSGKSIIPVVIGVGCGIPGVMATRTIKDTRQRRTTAMVATFIPCGAKVPVIALLAGAFFAGNAIITWSMYILGIIVIFLGAWLITALTGGKQEEPFFIMELPEYKWPSITKALLSMFDRAKHFIIKAATIILICNAVVQIMSSFNWSFQFVEDPSTSLTILETIATPFAWLLLPLGFGIWQLAAASITGFIAKENVVGTVATVFALSSFINEDLEIIPGSEGTIAAVMGITAVAALSFLVFNLFTPPCFAAIGAMNSEMNSRKWVWAALGFQLATGYVLAFLTYQFGTLFTTGAFGTGILGGTIAVLAIVAVFVFIGLKNNNKLNVGKKACGCGCNHK